MRLLSFAVMALAMSSLVAVVNQSKCVIVCLKHGVCMNAFISLCLFTKNTHYAYLLFHCQSKRQSRVISLLYVVEGRYFYCRLLCTTNTVSPTLVAYSVLWVENWVFGFLGGLSKWHVTTNFFISKWTSRNDWLTKPVSLARLPSKRSDLCAFDESDDVLPKTETVT
jgi:hypothetical protein